MQQFVLVPASAYNNKNLNSQSIAKQEFPKYPADENPIYKIDTLGKEVKRKIFVLSDSFVDKI